MHASSSSLCSWLKSDIDVNKVIDRSNCNLIVPPVPLDVSVETICFIDIHTFCYYNVFTSGISVPKSYPGPEFAHFRSPGYFLQRC